MRFFEVDSAVDAIMSAAMVAQGRASQQNKQGKLSMNGFLQMLANSGIMMDYDGFKTVFDTNPQLQNVIAKFDKDTITFAGDSDDEGEGYEEPQTDMPDDERVAKMAKRAMRTREFVESKLNEKEFFTGFEKDMADAIKKAYDFEWREANPGVDPIEELRKKHPEISQRVFNKIYDIVHPYFDGSYNELDLFDDKLPPHLAKMFGKDGRQVDTRTDVMKQMRDIVANKQATKVKFGDGSQMIDMYTASVLTQIYDKVNDNSKEAIIQRIGTKEKFNKLMPKLFGMLGEGHSPHRKGTKKYKAHMAAMHAGESVNEGMEDKIKADIKAGMSTDAIIGKYANKRTTNTDEIRKMIQKIKWNMRKNNESVEVTTEGFKIRDKSRGYGVVDKTYATRAEAEKARLLKMAQTGGDWEVIEERSLTSAEKDKMKYYEKKLPKQDFIDRYGKKEGEAIYYATATKMAKANA